MRNKGIPVQAHGDFFYIKMKKCKYSITAISMTASVLLHAIITLMLTFTEGNNQIYELQTRLIYSYDTRTKVSDNANHKSLNNSSTTWSTNKISKTSEITSPYSIAGDPQGEAMRLYEALILNKIQAAKYYPEHSQLRKEQGKVVVRFKLLSNGTLSGKPKIINSCKYLNLNKAALNTIISAAPFPKFDEEIAATEMTFIVALEYLL